MPLKFRLELEVVLDEDAQAAVIESARRLCMRTATIDPQGVTEGALGEEIIADPEAVQLEYIRIALPEPDRAAHHSEMGNLLPLNISIDQGSTDSEETGGCLDVHRTFEFGTAAVRPTQFLYGQLATAQSELCQGPDSQDEHPITSDLCRLAISQLRLQPIGITSQGAFFVGQPIDVATLAPLCDPNLSASPSAAPKELDS